MASKLYMELQKVVTDASTAQGKGNDEDERQALSRIIRLANQRYGELLPAAKPQEPDYSVRGAGEPEQPGEDGGDEGPSVVG